MEEMIKVTAETGTDEKVTLVIQEPNQYVMLSVFVADFKGEEVEGKPDITFSWVFENGKPYLNLDGMILTPMMRKLMIDFLSTDPEFKNSDQD